MESVRSLREIVKQSRKVVFFGGAGVSTESGIPDFRSQDGLYHTRYADPPETILSDAYFYAHPEEFYRFYRDKMLFLDAQPNAAHEKLAAWERAGKLAGIVTQNIDGLHRKAGNRKVFELHGSVYRNRCLNCGKAYPVEVVVRFAGVPRCECGGMLKPDVVLYGEPLDSEVVNGAIGALASADLLIVAGTSLAVYPAAGFLQCFRGEHIVLINRTPTPYDARAELVIRENIGKVFADLPDDWE